MQGEIILMQASTLDKPSIRVTSVPLAPKELSEFVGEIVLSSSRTTCYYAILPSYRNFSIHKLVRNLQMIGKTVFQVNYRRPEKTPFGYDPRACCVDSDDIANLARYIIHEGTCKDTFFESRAAELLTSILLCKESMEDALRFFYSVSHMDFGVPHEDFMHLVQEHAPQYLKSCQELSTMGTATRETIFATIDDALQKTFTPAVMRMMRKGSEGLLKPILFYPDFVYLLQVPEEDASIHNLIDIFYHQLCASMEQAGRVQEGIPSEADDFDENANELLAYIPENWY